MISVLCAYKGTFCKLLSAPFSHLSHDLCTRKELNAECLKAHLCFVAMLSSDGIGPIVEGLQNHTEEINQRLDDLGIVGPERQIIIDALLVLNDQCRVVGTRMCTSVLYLLRNTLSHDIAANVSPPLQLSRMFIFRILHC